VKRHSGIKENKKTDMRTKEALKEEITYIK
jgi:hypothetical protein